MKMRYHLLIHRGFTLVELLIGLLLAVIVIFSVVSFITGTAGVEQAGKNVGKLYEAGTLAMETITASIKSVNASDTTQPVFLTVPNGKTLSIANAKTVFFYTATNKQLQDTNSNNILPDWGTGKIEIDDTKRVFCACDDSGACDTGLTKSELVEINLPLKNTETNTSQLFKIKVGLIK